MIDVVFWGLETRSRELIHYSEECLKSIEERFPDEYSGAFKIIQNAERKTSLKPFRLTYAFWLTIPFVAIIIFGAISLIVVLA